MVKQFPSLFKWGLSQMTWNAFKPRYAPLEAARQFLLRKLGSQGVQSASPTREARLLTPHLARPHSNKAFAKAEPVAKAFLVETFGAKTTVVAMVQSCRTAPYLLANVRFLATASPP